MHDHGGAERKAMPSMNPAERGKARPSMSTNVMDDRKRLLMQRRCAPRWRLTLAALGAAPSNGAIQPYSLGEVVKDQGVMPREGRRPAKTLRSSGVRLPRSADPAKPGE